MKTRIYATPAVKGLTQTQITSTIAKYFYKEVLVEDVVSRCVMGTSNHTYPKIRCPHGVT